MMSVKQTERGNRADLAALAVNAPEGYIGSQIFPVLKTSTKAGKIYYTKVMAEAAAQTGRSVDASLTGTLLSADNLDYSVSEFIKRYTCPWAEVEQMGGLEAVDALGAKGSKRSVMRAIENAQAAALFDATSYAAATDISTGILVGVAGAVEACKKIKGKTALVMSNYIFNQIKQADEVKDLMFRSFGGLTVQQVLSLDPTAFLACLQGIFPVDLILIGDDDHWKISGQTDALAVVKMADVDETSHKLEAVYAKTVVYYGKENPAEPFEIYAAPNDDNHCNNYDATSWLDIEEFNATGKSLMTFSLATADAQTSDTTEATTAAA
jgi:hypothetical protein